MSSSISTREKLLSLVDDIELLTKELLENIIAPKPQKLQIAEHPQIAELLVMKDNELKSTLKVAAEQAEIQKKMDALQLEVEKQDMDIRQLQKHLKEAEHILATAIYQAKQKLQAIAKANEHSISSEELIKYAHRISASNAVAAPHNWQQGDPRRPYPTDIEMRLGFLGQYSDLPMSSSVLQHQQQGSFGDLPGSRTPQSDQAMPSQPGSFTWQPSNDLKSSISHNHSVAMETTKGHKENEDVEVMSTDSSSSSSSDSQ